MTKNAPRSWCCNIEHLFEFQNTWIVYFCNRSRCTFRSYTARSLSEIVAAEEISFFETFESELENQLPMLTTDTSRSSWQPRWPVQKRVWDSELAKPEIEKTINKRICECQRQNTLMSDTKYYDHFWRRGTSL